jgi:Tfp pilus assembly protein PilE
MVSRSVFALRRGGAFRQRHPPSTSRGIGLLETTVALVILALVTAYAIPRYREFVARGYRQAAITALYALSAEVEASLRKDHARGADGQRPGRSTVPMSRRIPAYRLQVRTALNVAGAGGRGDADIESEIDAKAENALVSSMAMTPTPGTRYLLVAVPLADGVQSADRCGIYVLDDRGNRANRALDSHGPVASEDCWVRQGSGR